MKLYYERRSCDCSKGATKCPDAHVWPTGQGYPVSADHREQLEFYEEARQRLPTPGARSLASFLRRSREAEEFAHQVLRPVVEELFRRGITGISQITKELNDRQIRTASGRGVWHKNVVSQQLQRACSKHARKHARALPNDIA